MVESAQSHSIENAIILMDELYERNQESETLLDIIELISSAKINEDSFDCS